MTIRTKPASKEYRDGWERVFGKGAEVEPYVVEVPEEHLARVREAFRVAFTGPHATGIVKVHGAKPSAIRERKP